MARNMDSAVPMQAEILVYNDSVIALACGTGGSLLGCVLIIGTGRLPKPPTSTFASACGIDEGKQAWQSRECEQGP